MDPSTRDLPPIAACPPEDALLPMEHAIWDGGRCSRFTKRLPVNAPVGIHLGSFQRAVQSEMIKHMVYSRGRQIKEQPRLPRVSTFADLDGDIRAMLEAMLTQFQKWEIFCDAFAMCMRFVDSSLGVGDSDTKIV